MTSPLLHGTYDTVGVSSIAHVSQCRVQLDCTAYGQWGEIDENSLIIIGTCLCTSEDELAFPSRSLYNMGF